MYILLYKTEDVIGRQAEITRNTISINNVKGMKGNLHGRLNNKKEMRMLEAIREIMWSGKSRKGGKIKRVKV